MRYAILILILAITAAIANAADNWPDFRGPHCNGHAASARLPLEWSESKNVKWKTAILHRGWSSPVVWGDQIWMTTARDDGKELFAVCVDQQGGAIVRNVKVFDVEEPEPINKVNSYASPSPVIEEGRVYVHFGTFGTACLDTGTGKILWERRDLKLDHEEGPGSSPILAGDLLVVHCDGMDVQYIVALDKRSGKTVWKTYRSIDLTPFREDLRKAYCTPLLADVTGGGKQVISTVAQCAYGYDLASGRELWRLPYNGSSNVSRPVAADGVLYLNTGFIRAQLWAVRLGGSGELDESRVVWKFTRSVPTMPSVLLVDGLIYMVSDKGGVATCVDAKNGDEIWTRRLGGNFSSSPIYAAGRIYFFDDKGKTTVIAPGRDYRVLAVNQLDDGMMASPAVSGNSLMLRTRSHLYRFEESKVGGKKSTKSD